jgi:L-iditol 2-dehydrogenase
VPSAWTRALKLLADGLVKTEPLVSGVFPLTAWRDAFDAFEKKSGLKLVLQPVD